jgi:hypothetical protein
MVDYCEATREELIAEYQRVQDDETITPEQRRLAEAMLIFLMGDDDDQ